MNRMKSIARRFAATFGYEIRRQSRPTSLPAAEFDALLAQIAGTTMLPRDRLMTLYEQVAFCQRAQIPGAMVECGVWKGGAVGLMALTIQRHNGPDRTLHLFDSFQDICAPDPLVDGQQAMQEMGDRPRSTGGDIQPMTGHYDSIGGHGTLELCRELLESRIGYPSELIEFHKGWFQDTIPTQAAGLGRIAVLRLDGDWYASTKICLDHLYDQVSPGGFVIFDDYGTYDGCRLAVDEFFAARVIAPYLHRVDSGCFYVVKPA